MEDWQEQYHSLHGAIGEAYHVFLKSGLYTLQHKNVSVLEVGFGTGLNAIITFLEARKRNLNIRYTGLEAYPVGNEELRQLNYVEMLGEPDLGNAFREMHEVSWGEKHSISTFFSLTKVRKDFRDFSVSNAFHLIYFDAFGPRVQPELWTVEVFQTMFDALFPAGILVTYSAKGSVRRAMQQAGFLVEKLPGPPGKREMLRAVKPDISSGESLS
nr:tRNA (5-methylaminomethyl-2-thiouridine)(34)-methyltransferase MnmD [Lentiprolixibacter aurantiacus]